MKAIKWAVGFVAIIIMAGTASLVLTIVCNGMELGPGLTAPISGIGTLAIGWGLFLKIEDWANK